MNRVLRVLSIIMPFTGIVFLVYYRFQDLRGGLDKISLFSYPSYYYIEENNMLAFGAGVVVLILSVLACFFSWFKKMDTESGAQPNALNASEKEISTWIEGSSLDTGTISGHTSGHEMGREDMYSDITEIIDQDYEDSGTELIGGELK